MGNQTTRKFNDYENTVIKRNVDLTTIQTEIILNYVS